MSSRAVATAAAAAASTTSTSWLTTLKAAELHKLAVLIGTPCSGTKATRIRGIESALEPLRHATVEDESRYKHKSGVGDVAREHLTSASKSRKVSFVSIDMGIKNLAYSHWTTQLEPVTALSSSVTFTQHTLPNLRAWRKIDVSEMRPLVHQPSKPTDLLYKSQADDSLANMPTGATFDPSDYADRAYDFVKTVIDEYKPDYVLIERQRFRSGGGAAVQEWTIRVGVLEGMLYAVLKSFNALYGQHNGILVNPVLPVRVNRYWFEEDVPGRETLTMPSAARKTARDVKLAKVELVRELVRLARGAPSSHRPFELDKSLPDLVSVFLKDKDGSDKNRGVEKMGAKQIVAKSPRLSKLDDLADCLLQGLAWVRWQNNRLMLAALGPDGVGLLK